MPVHTRSYFQLIEKRTVDVNPLWKGFHALIFILIVLVAIAAAFSFHDIYDSFHFQCILYAKPVVILDDIEYLQVSTAPTVPLNDSIAVNATSTNTTATNTTTTSTTTVATTKKRRFKVRDKPKYRTMQDAYWMVNSTLKGRVVMDFRESIFGPPSLCNAILFFPLVTVIFGIFFTTIVLMCSRGGKGYISDLLPRPWSYVYPFLAFSAIMLIINSVLATYLNNGMRKFCAGFKLYTGQESCSNKINYFTDEIGFGFFNLYQSYRLCLISFRIEATLWAFQVFLFISRIACIADFQLNLVTVSCKRRTSIGFDVHTALTTTHKLKKVGFEEETPPKDDDDKDDDDVTQV